jgi:hypothetical protein
MIKRLSKNFNDWVDDFTDDEPAYHMAQENSKIAFTTEELNQLGTYLTNKKKGYTFTVSQGKLTRVAHIYANDRTA